MPRRIRSFIGVSGIGGHESVPAWVAEQAPARILVLGSRLGEPSSLFDPRFVPRRGFVHVDLDPEVPGIAFPAAINAARRRRRRRAPARAVEPVAGTVRDAAGAARQRSAARTADARRLSVSTRQR